MARLIYTKPAEQVTTEARVQVHLTEDGALSGLSYVGDLRRALTTTELRAFETAFNALKAAEYTRLAVTVVSDPVPLAVTR